MEVEVETTLYWTVHTFNHHFFLTLQFYFKILSSPKESYTSCTTHRLTEVSVGDWMYMLPHAWLPLHVVLAVSSKNMSHRRGVTLKKTPPQTGVFHDCSHRSSFISVGSIMRKVEILFCQTAAGLWFWALWCEKQPLLILSFSMCRVRQLGPEALQTTTL